MDETNLRGLVFRHSQDEYGSAYQQHVVDIYKIYVEMADRVSSRRQSANSFYMSVNTAIVAAAALFSESLVDGKWLIALSGIAICAMWMRNIQSYKGLNAGKFQVICEIEKALPISPYEAEWEILGRGSKKNIYRPFHQVERVVPLIFILIYVFILFNNVNWVAVCGLFAGKDGASL